MRGCCQRALKLFCLRLVGSLYPVNVSDRKSTRKQSEELTHVASVGFAERFIKGALGQLVEEPDLVAVLQELRRCRSLI